MFYKECDKKRNLLFLPCDRDGRVICVILELIAEASHFLCDARYKISITALNVHLEATLLERLLDEIHQLVHIEIHKRIAHI